MNSKTASEMLIISMAFGCFFGLPMGAMLYRVDVDIPTLMNAMFESLSNSLPYLKGSFSFWHVLSLNIAASQLQSSRHAALHSSLVTNGKMEKELLNSHSILDIGSMV